MTPYLESSTHHRDLADRSRGSSAPAARTFSSQAYAQFDNHNADRVAGDVPARGRGRRTSTASPPRSRAGPNFGIVQLAIDGRPLGEPFDAYATARRAPRRRSRSARVALAEGKHMLTMTVTGKNAASTDYLAGLDLVVLDSAGGGAADPDRGGDDRGRAAPCRRRWRCRSARRADVRRLPARRLARVHGVDDGERDLHGRRRGADRRAIPGHLANGSFSLPQPLRVEFAKTAWSGADVERARSRSRSSRRSARTTSCAPAATRRRSPSR